MGSYTDYAWRDHAERRGPLPREASRDAFLMYQQETLRTWLTRFEMVMEDEGVAAHVIRRIITTLIYGQADPADSIMRMAREDELRDLIMSKTPSVVLTGDHQDLAAKLGLPPHR